MAGRKNTVPDQQILQLFEESDDPFLTTSEVADEFGFTNSGILKRLKALADDGKLGSKSAGKGKAWWLTDEGREYVAAEE
ncbi:winged helix-turn-helix domain-containing protein [Halorubrum sp. LN27]|uniref:winged helix-turn-helix transcriptional regulator n=1 Tax=Halorubrum sp. LN27 TaxID=2801032 RepID=UPI00190CB1E0|nr:winged helix-turn-helix domain-containing protein [Halorubrum sp. LN27]